METSPGCGLPSFQSLGKEYLTEFPAQSQNNHNFPQSILTEQDRAMELKLCEGTVLFLLHSFLVSFNFCFFLILFFKQQQAEQQRSTTCSIPVRSCQYTAVDTLVKRKEKERASTYNITSIANQPITHPALPSPLSHFLSASVVRSRRFTPPPRHRLFFVPSPLSPCAVTKSMISFAAFLGRSSDTE